MIVVTGGAGFIGSNLVMALNARGHDDVLVVDDLTDGTKFVNLVEARIADYMDKDEFLERVRSGSFGDRVEAVLHEGACSDTTEWDGRFMMRNNYTYSRELLEWCQASEAPFLYASSAAVYGAGPGFAETPEHEKPLNVYGYSKKLFDDHVRRVLPRARAQIVGFRYFNVYGPREQHKGKMASVAFHLNGQALAGERLKLFEGCDGYPDGGQMRDFVYVGDACDVNMWFLDHRDVSGIFNCGTGQARPFQAIAETVSGFHGGVEIEYISFPEHLRGRYQSFTEADPTRLREAGYERAFTSVEDGVTEYMRWLDRDGAR